MSDDYPYKYPEEACPECAFPERSCICLSPEEIAISLWVQYSCEGEGR